MSELCKLRPLSGIVIAVDFDGTIVTDAWPAIGSAVPEALDTIMRWQRDGARLILTTCRTGQLQNNAQEYLYDHCLEHGWQFPFEAVNENLTDRSERFGGDPRKLSADIYVDDRAIGFRLDWRWIDAEVRARAMELKEQAA